jgi:hypothetical protein
VAGLLRQANRRRMVAVGTDHLILLQGKGAYEPSRLHPLAVAGSTSPHPGRRPTPHAVADLRRRHPGHRPTRPHGLGRHPEKAEYAGLPLPLRPTWTAAANASKTAPTRTFPRPWAPTWSRPAGEALFLLPGPTEPAAVDLGGRPRTGPPGPGPPDLQNNRQPGSSPLRRPGLPWWGDADQGEAAIAEDAQLHPRGPTRPGKRWVRTAVGQPSRPQRKPPIQRA